MSQQKWYCLSQSAYYGLTGALKFIWMDRKVYFVEVGRWLWMVLTPVNTFLKGTCLSGLLGSCGQCILLEQLAVVRQFGYNCSVFFRCDENMWHPYVHSALRAVCALGVTLVVVNRPAVNYTDVLLNRLSAPVKWKPEILKGHENISVWMIHRVNCFKPFPGQNPSYLTYFIHYSHSFEWCNKTEIAFCEWHMDSLWLSIK